MTPGIPKYNESAAIAASQPTSYRGLPLLATLDEPYTCSTIGPQKQQINIQISLEDEINLIEHIYRTAKSNFSSPWIKRELKNTLCFHIQHRRMGRWELATQFCKDHGFDIDMLGDDDCIPLSEWINDIQMEITRKEKHKNVKIWSLGIIVSVMLMGYIYLISLWCIFVGMPPFEKKPDIPACVLDLAWIVGVFNSGVVLFTFGAILFIKLVLHANWKSVYTEYSEWVIWPISIFLGSGIMAIAILWIFSTQLWAWVVFFGPPAILNAIFRKRR